MTLKRAGLISLFVTALAIAMVPLSGVMADTQTYSLATITDQTIPLWGPTWNKTNVTVIVKANNGVDPAAVSTVEQAVRDWDAAIHAGLGGDSPFHLDLITEGKADITIRPKGGGGRVAGQALQNSDESGNFISCKVNVSGKGFGTANSLDEVLSIALQEIGHCLGLLHSNNPADVMFGTLQASPNTVISECDVDAWKAVMHWLLVDGPSAHPPHDPPAKWFVAPGAAVVVAEAVAELLAGASTLSTGRRS